MDIKCANCNKPITYENDSKEHIIPRAIGGRRTVSGFLCKSCNEMFGQTIDAKLSDQFSDLCLWARISRQGKPPASKHVKLTNGERMTLHADGQLTLTAPTFNKISEEGKESIHIQARSRSEAKKMISDLQRKYPQLKEINIEDLLTVQEVYPL